MAVGKAKERLMCLKCKKHIEIGQMSRWAPKRPGYRTHVNCYFYFTEGGAPNTPQPQPQPDKPPESSTSALKTPAPAPEVPKGGIEEMLVASVMSQIQPALDKAVAGPNVSQAIGRAVTTALETHTKTLIVKDESTGKSVKVDGLRHEQVDDVIQLLERGYNVYLYGGSGGGKTLAAKQIAEGYGTEFYMFQLSKQSTPPSIIGFANAQGVQVTTPFFEWYSKGGTLLIDEADSGNDNIWTWLNTAIANKFMSFPVVGMVEQHKDCRLIAAGNTSMSGANSSYSSRSKLDEATKERFFFVPWGYDKRLERKAALAHDEKSERWVDWVQSVRKSSKDLGVRLLATPRASIEGAKALELVRRGVISVADLAEGVMFKGLDKDSQKKVLEHNPLPSI